MALPLVKTVCRPPLKGRCSDPRPTDCSGQTYDTRPPIAVNCCNDCFPCIYLCNDNAIFDDDWDILLDGTFLGTYTSTNSHYDSLIILPFSMSSLTITGQNTFGCNDPAHATFIFTPLLDVIKSRYVLTMRLKTIRGQGNYGTVKILCAKPDGSLIAVGGSFTYGSPSPYTVGKSVRYNLGFNRAT